jgi:uncharacterized RDD family membrane protein YckC
VTNPPPPGNYPPPPPGNYPPPPGGGYQPPPPPPPGGGGYPPPPSAQGGYAPPPVGGGQALPQDAYTPWVTRVLAYLIDAIPVAIITGIGWVILLTTQECIDLNEAFGNYGEYGGSFSGQVCGASTLGLSALWIFMLLGLAFAIWNYGYKQGTTGSSIGKGIMKFKVVSEETGQPIGFGMSIVRQLAHAIDGIICYIGFLFPLWDQKRQTIADKLMKTVCLPV